MRWQELSKASRGRARGGVAFGVSAGALALLARERSGGCTGTHDEKGGRMEHWQNHMHRQLHKHVQDWIKAGRPRGAAQDKAPGVASLATKTPGAPRKERARMA